MYVLCTLAVLTLHSLLRSWNNKAVEPSPSSRAAGQQGPQDGAVPEARGGGDDPVKSSDRRGPRSGRAEGKRRRGGGMHNIPDSRKRVQVRRCRSGFLNFKSEQSCFKYPVSSNTTRCARPDDTFCCSVDDYHRCPGLTCRRSLFVMMYFKFNGSHTEPSANHFK